ncbi:MAG: MFS transporter [Acidobacteriaceae bacterium]|nr:MFS transporter [Acidobacteriaceae bacterium]
MPRPGRLPWIALALLVISVCINYADRGNLGVAARSVQKELHLNAHQLGYLLAAFSFTYALSQIVTAKVIDRWNVNWVYAWAFLLWSAATAATGLAGSFAAIFGLRLVLGASESVAYPAYSKMICISFPEQLRGTANALIDAGSKIGPALGILVGIEIVEHFSWRGMFLIIGAGSLLWLVPWCLVAPRLPVRHTRKTFTSHEAVPSYGRILARRELWGTALGLFGGNYAWFFLLNWVPYYLETERHYSKNALAIVGSLPFWAVAVASVLFGMLADVFVRRRYSAGRVRQGFVCAGQLASCALMLPAVLVSDRGLGTFFLILSCIAMGAWSSNHWALTQLLSGPAVAGKWTGLQNCFGNFAGVVGQIVTGYALQSTHSFFAAFAIACLVLIAGVIGYWVVVGQPKEISWPQQTIADRTHNVEHESSPLFPKT